ncbi:MAG: Ig domain-containing protein, partial [Thermoanaerobaculia bacterium]
YSDTVTASNGVPPYAYSVTGGSLPIGLSIDAGSGEISGSPQESGIFDVNATASDTTDCTGTRSYNFSIACPTITLSPPQQLADAFAGEPYLDNITGNGGTPPYTYEVVTGTTHNGVFLGEGGTIFGMTEAGGTKQFRVVATDANGCFNAASHQFRVDSSNCFDGALLCDNMSDPTINFTATDACGGGAEWYAENSCSSSDDIAHTPSAHARWGTNLSCLDYGTVATQDTLTSVEIDTSVCTSGEVILDFNYLLSFDGNPDSERARVEVVADGGATQVVADNGGVAGPTCPAGEANAGLGNLKSWSGWQHLRLTLPATSTFQVSFVGETDDGSTEIDGTDGFEGFLVDDVHVRCKCPDDFEVTPTLLEPAVVDTAYSVQFVATGGREPYDFDVLPGSPAPAGLSLDSASGLLSGTPTTNGIHEFTLVLKDANFCEIRVILSLIVSPTGCAAITLAPEELPDEEEGTFYSQVITPTGVTGPDPIFALTAGALPSGLSLSPALGVVSGTPDTPGIYQFTVTVVDELTFCSGSQEYTIIINPVGCPLIEVFPEVLANAGAGEPYSQTFTATGGVAPYSWFLSAGDLPPDLTLDETSGIVSGVPMGNAIFSFAITAQDQKGCFGTRSYGLEVVDFPPRVVNVHSVSDTGDGQLSDETTHASITQLYVTLSEIVQDPVGDTDPDDVTNPANYLLAHAGSDGTLETSSCLTGVDGADVAISVDSATWDEPALAARLRINGGQQLLYGAYRLLVCGSTSLVDVADQPLDGDGDFIGGDDFMLDFGVDVDNVLVNPNLDDDLAAWTASSPTETSHSPNDAGSAPTSGSISVATVPTQATVSQCVSVTDDEGYYFAAKGWIESELSTDPSLSAEIRFFTGAGCTGGTLSTKTLTGPSGDSDGGLIFADGFECGDLSVWLGGAPCAAGPAWLPMSSWMATPSSAVSAEIRVVVDPGASTGFTVNTDDLLFFHMLFGDGFESGDTSAW